MIASVGVTQRVNNRAARRNAHAAVGFAQTKNGRGDDRRGIAGGGGDDCHTVCAIIADRGGVADLVHACCHRIDDRNGERARTTGCARQAADGKRTRCASVAVRRTHPTCRACARVEARVGGHGFAQGDAGRALIASVGVTQRVNNRAAGRNAHATIAFAQAQDGCGGDRRGVRASVVGGSRISAIRAVIGNCGGVADLADTGCYRIDHRHSKRARTRIASVQPTDAEGTACACGRTSRTTPARRTCARIEGCVGGHGFAQHHASCALIAGVGVVQGIHNRAARRGCCAAIGFAAAKVGRGSDWGRIAGGVVSRISICTTRTVIANRSSIANLVYPCRNRRNDGDRKDFAPCADPSRQRTNAEGTD